MVATPTGHSTSGFGTSFCAYHGDVTEDPNITYTNLPYMTDAGGSCGEDSVNGSNGTLDGVSIVEGHELAETITDPLLNGWFNASGEIGDLCAWTDLANLTTTTGTFPVQPLWSNAANGCAQSPASPLTGVLTSDGIGGHTGRSFHDRRPIVRPWHPDATRMARFVSIMAPGNLARAYQKGERPCECWMAPA